MALNQHVVLAAGQRIDRTRGRRRNRPLILGRNRVVLGALERHTREAVESIRVLVGEPAQKAELVLESEERHRKEEEGLGPQVCREVCGCVGVGVGKSCGGEAEVQAGGRPTCP